MIDILENILTVYYVINIYINIKEIAKKIKIIWEHSAQRAAICFDKTV